MSNAGLALALDGAQKTSQRTALEPRICLAPLLGWGYHKLSLS